ncbi:MAG: site-2 protease family protein [Eubacterium sp.]|nr:site-2 protease family protein [Eubacterium sp.]
MLKIVAIILMFGIIVFVHEFGHFLFAKLNHVRVNEFAIGMGPAIMKFGKKETTYSIRILPIGGYCLMAGQDGEETDDPEGTFESKSVLARLSIMLAGPFFNFLLAVILSIGTAHFYLVDPPVISAVSQGSAAEEAGMEPGDEIVALNGESISLFREVTLFRQIEDLTKPIEVTYLHDGQQITKTMNLTKEQNYMFGITCNPRDAKNFGEELYYALVEVRFQITTVIKSVKMLFTGKASVKDLSGPVGIGSMMSDVIDEAQESGGTKNAILSIISFMILVSANLGVMNLLPIPALDGGRILFLLIEAVTRKRVPKEKEAIVNFIGFALLMLLMIFVFFNDIVKLFR